MKKLLLATLFCGSFAVNAQIIDHKTLEPKTVTKVSIMGAKLIDAEWFDNYTYFSFEDAKYQTLKVQGHFTLTSTEIESFYGEIKNRFNKDVFSENEGFMFDTKEGTTVDVKFVKSMGVKSIKISTVKNGVVAVGPYLTQKQTKKLFNDESKS